MLAGVQPLCCWMNEAINMQGMRCPPHAQLGSAQAERNSRGPFAGGETVCERRQRGLADTKTGSVRSAEEWTLTQKHLHKKAFVFGLEVHYPTTSRNLISAEVGV